MILRLIEALVLAYCVFSYGASAYALYSHRNDEMVLKTDMTSRVVAGIIFVVFAPLFMLYVIWEKFLNTLDKVFH